jgi:hypothetical protein
MLALALLLSACSKKTEATIRVVKNYDNQVAANAEVEVYDASSNYEKIGEGLTNSKGEITFELTPGTYEVDVYSEECILLMDTQLNPIYVNGVFTGFGPPTITSYYWGCYEDDQSDAFQLSENESKLVTIKVYE